VGIDAAFVINYFIKSSMGVLIYEHSHFTQSDITKIFEQESKTNSKIGEIKQKIIAAYKKN